MSVRVLIADDHSDHVMLLREMLLSRGHQVDAVQDGAMALELLRSRRAEGLTYHLLITDLMMPGKDGLQVIQAIRQDQDLMPMALITAYGATALTLPVESRRFNLSDVIEKPIDLARIDRLLIEAEAYAIQVERNLLSAPTGSSAIGTKMVHRPISDAHRINPGSTPPATSALERKRTTTFGQPQPPVDDSLPQSGEPPATPTTSVSSKRSTPLPQRDSGGFPMLTQTTRTARSTGRGSGMHAPPTASTTSRIRRSVAGSFTQDLTSQINPVSGTSVVVICSRCGKEFRVPRKTEVYTTVCIHCGHFNAIQP